MHQSTLRGGDVVPRSHWGALGWTGRHWEGLGDTGEPWDVLGYTGEHVAGRTNWETLGRIGRHRSSSPQHPKDLYPRVGSGQRGEKTQTWLCRIPTVAGDSVGREPLTPTPFSVHLSIRPSVRPSPGGLGRGQHPKVGQDKEVPITDGTRHVLS